MSPEQIGVVAIVTTIISFFSMFMINPVSAYYNRRFFSLRDSGFAFRFLNYLGIYIAVIALLAACITYTTSKIMGENWGVELVLLVILVGLGVFLTNASQILAYFVNMLKKRTEWLISVLITIWVGLFFAWIATEYSPSAFFWIGGQFIGMFAGSIFAYYFFYTDVKVICSDNIKYQINFSIIKKMLIFSGPLALAIGLHWIQFQSYRFIIEDMFSLEMLGFFMVGYTLSSGIMGAFESALSQLYHPSFFKMLGEKPVNNSSNGPSHIARVWADYSQHLITLTIFSSIFLIIISKPLFIIFMTEQYFPAWKYFLLGCIVELFRIIGGIYGLGVHASMETRYILVPYILGSIAIIGGLIIMISVYGEAGIFYGLIVSGILFVGVFHLVICRHMDIKIRLQHFPQILQFIIIAISMLLIFNLLIDDKTYMVIFIVLASILYFSYSTIVIKKSKALLS
ncbi:MAG: oligosaccharide flippase family protein [Gammaproteobacteria bacterium]|nr:oligosaccharide flippase family protein [Gammaproteobacteria bacterium]